MIRNARDYLSDELKSSYTNKRSRLQSQDVLISIQTNELKLQYFLFEAKLFLLPLREGFLRNRVLKIRKYKLRASKRNGFI